MIRLVSPKNNSTVRLLTDAQRAFIENGGPYTAEDISIPEPVVFTCEPAVSGELTLISRGGDERKYSLERGRAEVYNLLANEEYRWYVTAGFMRSETHTFKTEADVPRFLYVEGLSNVRDIGGFEGLGGKRVRQGMVFRATEPQGVTNLTKEGRETLRDELKIRTDLDFRGINGEEVRESLGDIGANFVNIPLAAYADIFTEEQMRAYKSSFELLAKREFYPIIAHCQCGMDRTGTWLYILGALLGVDEGELALDYELSSLSRWGERSRGSEDFKAFLEKFHAYGASARVAAENFLAACGVSDEVVELIRSNLIEDSL